MLIRMLGQGKVGNAIVHFFSSFFHMSWEAALSVYWVYIRSHLTYILFIVIIIFFLILFWVLLSWFMRYFDEVVKGVNQLVSGKQEPIAMSPELDFMEEKLNQVQAELEKSRRAKLDAEKRKNDLILYLAHDIKTPLTSVIGYLNLLYESPDLPTEQRVKYVEITLKKAERLERLINEFFEITRYHLQAVSLIKAPFDLSYMLVQVIDEAYPLLVAKSQTILTDFPESLCVFADADQLVRVFHNLLKNAISYSAAETVLTISAEKRKEMVVICFENEGTIPPEALNRIFEKFYRADQSRQSDTGGFGLGLAIAKDIVELHGGNIFVECTNNRILFTVVLPINAA